MSSRAPRPLVALVWSIPVLVLLQAGLAGQAWFQQADLFGIHGGIGHSVLLLSVITAAWIWLSRIHLLAAVLATMAVVAIVGQTGLGYAGHRSGHAIASSLHIPLGTAILAVTAIVAVLVSMRRTPA